MKKKMALLLSVVLAMSFMAVGCGKSDAPLKTGVGMITTVSSPEDGATEADAAIAAVTVGADEKIVSCTIDIAQTAINFSADGKITSDKEAAYPSKQEKGADYGMKAASAIGKEWNEQADAFAAYCVGKTANEVLEIAVNEQGVAADADLAASCSMHIGDLQEVVVKAVGNATEAGAKAGDKLGLGVTTSIADSKDAGDEDGVAQAYTTLSVVTVDGAGKITSAIIDAVQANVNFDKTGKITSDLTAPVSSKNELGDKYGMKAASSIGKEWNEQAAAYAAYAVGKTADEVNGTAVTEGKPSDADLAASVTVHIAGFNDVITKAVKNAK